ncbi:hypothetical protein CYMTET_53746 [Cymbomonas tetramitiformis]|uniref:Uncharacterized protein n=1 Tax=Cymbomonas tetramitiformis TaxID=36881 RepID=A0AAE0BG91_9CHLO|nr:hypothetical protein CYMTET_53746 [Cymbomonas tetramitiformis]
MECLTEDVCEVHESAGGVSTFTDSDQGPSRSSTIAYDDAPGTRRQNIYSKATDLLCEASRERCWVPARKLPAFNGLYQSVYFEAFGDLEWWKRRRDQCKWNGPKIWRIPTRVKLYTDACLYALGGVLNLKLEARGFWRDELRQLHITHLEIKENIKTANFKTFLRELQGKVVRLYCDNKAVVAMLAHFTSRNPDLMRRMRRHWSLLDLDDIELRACYIRNEANAWADRLSRDTDVDDRKLNRHWFDWAQAEWGAHRVDRFASEISAQLPRYYAEWWDPHCEGVDSLAYNWRGDSNWNNPPWGLLAEVAHKLWEEGAGGMVVAPYWPGQSWFRVSEASVASAATPPMHAKEARLEVYWLLDDAWYGGTVTEVSDTGQHHIQYNDVHMQEQALKETTRGNYGPKIRKFKDFCDGEGREWLIEATSMQPYLSAINNYHEDMGLSGLVKGRSVTYAVKALTLEQENRDQIRWLRACTHVALALISFGRPHMGTPLQQKNVLMDEEAHSTQKGATTCARAVGVVMEKVCFLGGWAQLSAAVQAYVDQKAVPDQAMRSYFGRLAPQGICAEGC